MPSPIMPSLILPFHDIAPVFAGPAIHGGPRSAVLGRATIGAGAWFGADAVVRADGETVHLGDNVHLGPRATVHIVHDQMPARVGNDVTVGANSVVHACTVEDGCVIENDVMVLDGAHVEAGVLIEACATVFPRKRLPGGWIYAGSPAKPVRELKPGELAARAASLRAKGRVDGGGAELPPVPQGFGEAVFIARTAQGAGRLDFAPGSSLFFSCIVDAGDGSIAVGADTNIQDNTVIRAGAGSVVIGRDVTVGHNVTMGAVTVGDGSLIGMGARLADGVRVEGDAMVAAGATTEPGQVLDAGWLWGGRPAKAMSRLDESRRSVMREIIGQYRGYGQVFRRLQQAHG